MAGFIRFLYRIFIKNSVIRWMWMIAIGVYGAKWASENLLGKTKSIPKKTILRIENHTITNFSIQKGEEDEMDFSRKDDTTWFVTKGNITAKIRQDTIAAFLEMFNQMRSVSVRKIPKDIEDGTWKPTMKVDIRMINTATRAFSIFYAERITVDSLVTYIKAPKRRILLGVKGDLYSVLNPNFNDYRDKNILRFKDDMLTRFTIRSKKDTLIFEKKDSTWSVLNPRYQVIPKMFKGYLNSMDTLKGFVYYDGTRDILDDKKIDNQIVIANKKDSSVLTTYKTDKGFIVHSSQNNDAYFLIDSSFLGYRNFKYIVKPASKKKGK